MKTIRELRILQGPHWRLPVEVFWVRSQDTALVRIGNGKMPILKIWREAASKLLDNYSLNKVKNNLWSVNGKILEYLAARTAETDPEKLVEWTPAHAAVVAPPTDPGGTCRLYRSTKRVDARREFFSAFIKKHEIPFLRSPEAIEILWHMLMVHAMDWMINRQKPLDLVFCQVFPILWTAGWQERFHSKKHHYSWNHRMLRTLVAGQHRTWSEKYKVALWRLEVRPEVKWWKTALMVERIRRRKLRGQRYLESIDEAVRRSLPDTVDLYRAYCAEKRQVAFMGGRRIAQDGHLPGENRGVLVIHRRSDGTVARCRWSETGIEEAVAPKDGGLPQVPLVQPEGRYMWEQGRLVYEYGLRGT